MVASNVGLPLVGDAAFRRPVRSRDRFSWQNHLSLAMTSFDFGHSFFEPIYRYEQGRFLLRKLEWRPPQTISKVSVASDGGLVSISQNLPGTKPIPVERLVAYINDREGGIYARPGHSDTAILRTNGPFGNVLWLSTSNDERAPLDVYVALTGLIVPSAL